VSLLIKDARLLTMTEAGVITGDLLIEQGRISRFGCRIDPEQNMNVIHADGLTVMPGMIDLCIWDDGADPSYTMQTALASGITTYLQMKDGAGLFGCLMGTDDECAKRISCIDPDAMSATVLQRRLCDEEPVIAMVRDQRQCESVLSAAEGSAHKPVLAVITGSYDMINTIAESGCGVIIGANRTGGISPWNLAARLDERGVTVAVSTCYPSAKMKVLPLCAGLCMREGMPHNRALYTFTRNPADMLGLSDCGRIAVGCKADLAIFDGDPLLLATSHVMTIANGKLINPPAQRLTHQKL